MIDIDFCSYCGGKAKVYPRRIGKYRREGENYQVTCNRCHARGPIKDTEYGAIMAWNNGRD